MTLCRNVLATVPHHAGASELLHQLEARFEQARRFYTEIDRDMDRQPLGHATTMVQEAMGLFPGHPDAQLILAKLHVRADQYKRSMKDGESALQQGDCDGALTCYHQALTSNPGSRGASRAIAVVSGYPANDSGNTAADRCGDWSAAMAECAAPGPRAGPVPR
jgi:hypothetical protein